MKWLLEHVLIPLILVIIAALFLPMAAYHCNIGGNRTRDLNILISLVSQEIERAEDSCGMLGSAFREVIDEAKTHRGNAEDALVIQEDLKTAENEIKKAQECLKEAREMCCPDIRVPPAPSEWWQRPF